MIDLIQNEQLGELLPFLYDIYDIERVEGLIDETMGIDNLSQLSSSSKEMIQNAAKKNGLKVNFREKVAKTFWEVHKYNPYHDKRGRFTTSKGSHMVVVKTPQPWDKFSSIGTHIDPKTGKISKEREKLYNSIIEKHFEGVEKPSGRPKLEYMGGGGASGKSYTLESGYLKNVPKGKKAVQINADDIKAMLPEYNQRVDSGIKAQQKGAAAYVHQESSILASQIASMAMDRGYNVVIDGTASNASKLKKEIAKARKNGYEVNAHYINAPLETALASNKKRFEQEGRYVPDNVLIKAHKDVSKNFEKLAESNLFDSVEIINNNRKDPLKTIYQRKKGEDPVVNDEQSYKEFLRKKDF